jgi:sulfite exporter TauE/SafE
MSSYLIAFITGLTTGGLSCLAVQGGLLASSLGQQIETDIHPGTINKPLTSFTILLFLAAKMIAYTILGALLGGLGSLFQLTSVIRAILFIAIGIFMLGNALRILNVHPIFRFFIFEPPSWLTRYIRQKSKNKANNFASLFLGALTVLIPCGVTQAIMALAIGSGSPIQGALLMFSFILGTSPVFFLVVYLTTKLGSRLEKYFLHFIAFVILILGLVSINSGLNLMASPLSIENLARNLPVIGLTGVQIKPTSDEQDTDPYELVINVKNDGYVPNNITSKANAPLKIKLVTKNTRSCARAFIIPSLNIERLLDATGILIIDIPPQNPGTIMRFSCSMGMYTGQITFN